MTKVNISLQDLAARKGIGNIQSRLSNLQPAFSSMGEYMMRRATNNFKSQSDPDGNSWAPLTERYRRRKKNTKILTESGRLRASINYRTTGKDVIIGTNVKYARVHQLGWKKRNIPARPYLGASEKDLDKLADILLGYLEK